MHTSVAERNPAQVHRAVRSRIALRSIRATPSAHDPSENARRVVDLFLVPRREAEKQAALSGPVIQHVCSGLLPTPLLGIFSAAAILDEPLEPSLFLAMTLIIGGIALGTVAAGSLRTRNT